MPDCEGPGWFSCCGGDCTPFVDHFGRPDSDDIDDPSTAGQQWHEVSGDWDIYNNTLRSTSDGTVMYLPTVAEGESFYARFKTVDEQDGDEWELLINSDNPAGTGPQNYYSVRFTRDSPTSVTLALLQVENGVETVLDSWSTTSGGGGGCAECPGPCSGITPIDENTTRTVAICLSSYGIGVMAYDATPGLTPGVPYVAWYRSSPVIETSRVWAGFKSGGSPVRFDDFYLEINPQNTSNKCGTCSCFMEDNSYPPNEDSFLATIVNTYGGCTNLEGVNVVLSRDWGCLWTNCLDLGGGMKGCIGIRFMSSTRIYLDMGDWINCVGTPGSCTLASQYAGGTLSPANFLLGGPIITGAPAVNCNCTDPLPPPPPVPTSGWDLLITDNP